MIGGGTELLAILGDPIRQARSPEIANALLRESGEDARLLPFHVAPAALAPVVGGLRRVGNLRGIVLTVPHKVAALGLVEHLRPDGDDVGAINAMRPRASGDGWEGDMFDGAGFIAALAARQVTVAGRRVLLVGAGGAGRAIAVALASAGAARIDLHDVDAARVADVAALLGRRGVARVTRAAAAFDDHDIVVNATPLGMREGDALPIRLDGIGPGRTVFDIVPAPDETTLMRQARALGAEAIGGREMIAGQARALLGFFGYAHAAALP